MQKYTQSKVHYLLKMRTAKLIQRYNYLTTEFANYIMEESKTFYLKDVD